MEKLEVAGWKKTSCDDGPGNRSVLFLQGCSMKCPGCHNPQSHKKGEGIMLEISEVEKNVIRNCHNKKLTISGGEPLEQWGSLKELVKSLKQKEFDICIYSGWDKERIPEDVFELVDCVKCGNFDYRKVSDDFHFAGSVNQRMYKKDAVGHWQEIDLFLRV